MAPAASEPSITDRQMRYALSIINALIQTGTWRLSEVESQNLPDVICLSLSLSVVCPSTLAAYPTFK